MSVRDRYDTSSSKHSMSHAQSQLQHRSEILLVRWLLAGAKENGELAHSLMWIALGEPRWVVSPGSRLYPPKTLGAQ